jgi:hypothetical protein
MDEGASWSADDGSTPEFRERIGRVRQHTDEFRPAEAELAVRVESA